MAETEDARKVLLDQAAALNMDVNPEWTVDELAEKVLEAEKAKADADKAKIKNAKKKATVKLLRNAFLVADEKLEKGAVVEVPIDTAKAWIEAGVAVATLGSE